MGRWCFPDVIMYGDDEAINSLVKRWNRLRSDGTSKAEKVLEVFIAGIEAMEAKEGFVAPHNHRQEKIQELRTKRQRLVELIEIREEMGPDEFTIWCQENNEDSELPYQVDFTLDHRDWLDRFLKDGLPYQVSVIKAQAEEDGFDDTAWHKMENYAARKGYKKMYGVWQKKP